jgi:hypothetical protein
VNILRPLRSLTWKHWAWATAIPVLIAITMPLQNFHQNWYWAQWRVLTSAPWFLFFSYTLLVAIAIAESTVAPDTGPPAWRYVVALGVATVIYATALGTFPDWLPSAPREIRAGQTVSGESAEPGTPARRINTMLTATGVMVNGGVAMWIYVGLRKSRRAARALAEAEIERSQAQRNLLAAQLVAAHAQVDPEFVLRTLEEVERTYETDAEQGDILLDEFIVYLRNAIPRLRGDEIVAATP